MSTEPTTTPAPVISPAPTVTPNTAATARAALNGLVADKDWSAKFFAGDAATRRVFSELTQAIADGDDVADALSGTAPPSPAMETVSDGQLPARHLASVIDGMRESGISDAAIAQAVKGTPVTAQELHAARFYQTARHADKDWTNRLLSGDPAARREQLLLSIILSNGNDESRK